MKDFLKIMIASALGFLIAQILISIIAMVMFIGAAGSIFSSMSSEKFVLQNNSVLNLRLDGTIVERVADPDPFTSMLSSQYPSAMGLNDIVSAIRKAGTQHIVIKEKVIFTKSSKRTGATADAEAVYDYSVCADYACNEVLDSKTGVKESDYYNNPIELADYEAQATTITYTFFKDSVNEYHFLSSSKDK